MDGWMEGWEGRFSGLWCFSTVVLWFLVLCSILKDADVSLKLPVAYFFVDLFRKNWCETQCGRCAQY
jgi:hypothetical protein